MELCTKARPFQEARSVIVDFVFGLDARRCRCIQASRLAIFHRQHCRERCSAHLERREFAGLGHRVPSLLRQPQPHCGHCKGCAVVGEIKKRR